MVTTQLDFVHLRTTVGLARQVRRIARKLKNKKFEEKFQKLDAKLDEEIGKGSIDGVKAAFSDIVEAAKKKDHYLFIAEKDELIILNEEEKNVLEEQKLEDALRPLLEKVAASNPKLLEEFKSKIDAPFHDVIKRVHERTEQIRRVLALLKADEKDQVAVRDFLAKFKSESGREARIKREEYFVKRYIKIEKKGLIKLYKDLSELHSLVKANKLEKAEKVLHKMSNIEKKVFDDMKAEADFIYDIITQVSYIYVSLLDFVTKNTAEKLAKLKGDKFPEQSEAELEAKRKDLIDLIYDHLSSIYGLGRRDEIRAR